MLVRARHGPGRRRGQKTAEAKWATWATERTSSRSGRSVLLRDAKVEEDISSTLTAQ